MDRITMRDRARYAFDNFMARGTSALLLGLFAASLLVILAVSLAVWLFGAAGESGLDFPTLLWYGLLRTLDPGTMGGDQGSPAFLGGMLAVTLGGIFVISTLIGVINAGLQMRIAELRKGRSRVIEDDHTVILGWSSQVFTIIAELVEANRSRRRAAIVILADRDKVEMEDEIRSRIRSTATTRIVCRSGSPLDPDDLGIVSVRTSRSIIVLAPTVADPDADVIKTMLAITKHPASNGGRYHIVAEILDRANLEVARMVGRDEVELIASEEITSRVIAQTCRQSGLSAVYSELLDFAGDEIYFVQRPGLNGRTYGQILTAFRNATVIGLAPEGESPMLNPPSDTLIRPGDRLVVVAPDDAEIHGSLDAPEPVDEALMRQAPRRASDPERTLVLGWNHRAPAVIRELGHYAPAGSEVLVVASSTAAGTAVEMLSHRLADQRLRFRAADSSARATLEALDLGSFDHVVVLCYSDELSVERADARTLITLLHLRELTEKLDRRLTIVSEMLDVRDRALAEVARADDFIVSDELISLMITQVSENRHLNAVFQTLLDPSGLEIYLRPAAEYVVLDQPVPFAAVVESARRRGESAFGYRIAARVDEPSGSFGVRLNPRRDEPITFRPDDRVVVLADA